MRVELAARVAREHVQQREVADAGDLHVVLGVHEVHALERAVRDHARAAPGLGAPGDLDALGVADALALLWRSPEAEVVCVVEPRGLALARLGAASAALVRARLFVRALIRNWSRLGKK